MTHQEMIDVITAHKEGKKLEAFNGTDINFDSFNKWRDISPISLSGLIEVMQIDDVRIKHEPKKRLMTARELAGRWIKKSRSNDFVFFAPGFMAMENPSGLWDGEKFLDIHNYMLYCDDIRNPEWKSVEIEVEDV